ncbi:hypothetical protein AG0111_0g2483 [Alternaria gaisen]|uniref:Uncharacterized protein n=1 Tax=Alternaria gaisen TaxID=167740 RepID=A0ACB6FWT1_9PLEO|nr:hypothetical protein AG0111_0g2483 [Alternaria gaisen]
MLAQVLFKDLSARLLRKPWHGAITGWETEEKKMDMKRMALDWWPLSSNQNTAWKKVGGTSEEESEPAEELIV